MNILFLGPQGSGKGTQARLLAEKTGGNYIESGAILREEAKTDEKINRIINTEGRLLSDDESFGIIKKFIEKKFPRKENLIFDGFPRSVGQYQLLNAFLGETGKTIDKAILLVISKEETVKRLSARRVCEKCGEVYNLITNPPTKDKCSCGGVLVQRPDDTPEKIIVRLSQYEDVTSPLIEKIKSEGKLIQLDGERPIETIFEDIKKELLF